MNTLVEILARAPAVIVAVAVLVVALRGFRRLEARMGNLHVGVEQIEQTTTAVNRAVNCVPESQPTLRTLVGDIHQQLAEHIEHTDRRLVRIEEHLTSPKRSKNA